MAKFEVNKPAEFIDAINVASLFSENVTLKFLRKKENNVMEIKQSIYTNTGFFYIKIDNFFKEQLPENYLVCLPNKTLLNVFKTYRPTYKMIFILDTNMDTFKVHFINKNTIKQNVKTILYTQNEFDNDTNIYKQLVTETTNSNKIVFNNSALISINTLINMYKNDVIFGCIEDMVKITASDFSIGDGEYELKKDSDEISDYKYKSNINICLKADRFQEIIKALLKYNTQFNIVRIDLDNEKFVFEIKEDDFNMKIFSASSEIEKDEDQQDDFDIGDFGDLADDSDED